MKRSQKLLLTSILLALASWIVPVAPFITLPLQYLYTHLHEIGHAIAATLSGGTGITIIVFADGSGITGSNGGSQLLVSPAGYVGATSLGAMILAMSRSPQGSKNALLTTAALLGIGLIVWIRGDVVGVISALVVIAALWFLGQKLIGDALTATGQFLGAYLCLASLQAVFSIFGFGSVAMQENDAVILEKATGIPAHLSALLWAGISTALVLVILVRSWKSAQQ